MPDRQPPHLTGVFERGEYVDGSWVAQERIVVDPATGDVQERTVFDQAADDA